MKIMQSWDDGIVSDIRLTEILRRYQAKASFCLTPGLYQESRSWGWMHDDREVWRLGLHELIDVYQGFEISSHSMTHPYLTDLPTDRLDWELQTSRHILEEIFQRPVRGFCYPFHACNDFVKEAVHRAGYRWARGREQPDGLCPYADPLEVHPCCHVLDDDFWGKYERYKSRNGLFFFWGHSYDMKDETMWAGFEAMIERISLDSDAEWVFAGDLFF